MSNFYQRVLLSLFLIPIIVACVYMGGNYFNFLLFVIAILGFYEIYILKKNYVKILILFLLIIFLFFSYFLRLSNNGLNIILFCLLISWFSDTGGYIFGKVIGGKKINIISPNKTYSGFIGALLFPQILSIYVINFDIVFNKSLLFDNLSIFLLSASSIFGDLFFSYLKRIMKIKDFSNILPGHGGIFDRIDGLIFVVICFLIIEY